MEETTISAHVDIATASRINNLAKTEQRQTSEIAEMALKFFLSLPPEARTALWQIEALASPDDFEQITREIARALLHAQYKVAHEQIMTHIKVDNLDQLETEDDILAAAIAVTR